MDKMKTLFAIIALSLGCISGSLADYMIPQMSAALPRITDILDVEVTSMNKEGHASIKILKAYKSSKHPAKVITGTDLSCTGGSPKMFGMKSGQRYIVLLTGNNLYEERSYFPVQLKEGVPHCQPGWYGGKTWLKCNAEWIPLKEFESKVAAAMSKGSIGR